MQYGMGESKSEIYARETKKIHNYSLKINQVIIQCFKCVILIQECCAFLVFMHNTTSWSHSSHRQYQIVDIGGESVSYRSTWRHFKLRRTVRNQVTLTNMENGIFDGYSRDTSQRVPGNVTVSYKCISLLKINAGVTSSDSSSQSVSVSVENHVGCLNDSFRSRATNIYTSGSAIVYVAFLNGNKTAVNIDYSTPWHRRDIDSFHVRRRTRQDYRNWCFIVRTHVWLDLYGSVSVPYVDSIGIVNKLDIHQFNGSLTHAKKWFVVTTGPEFKRGTNRRRELRIVIYFDVVQIDRINTRNGSAAQHVAYGGSFFQSTNCRWWICGFVLWALG